MRRERLHLRILGTRFRLEADARWVSLLTDLWGPFRDPRPDDADAVPGSIGERGGRWELRLGDRPRDASTDPWTLAFVLRAVLVREALARARGTVELHAAVVARDGEALLLTGRPSAGKTTLALRLCERGWALYSDDVAPIDLATGRVHAFPKPVGLRREGWDRYGDRWTPPAWLPAPTAPVQVPASALGALGAAPVRAGAVLFLSRGHGEARLHPATPARAAAFCAEYAGRCDAETLRALGMLTSRCRSAELHMPDPPSGLPLLGAWIKEDAGWSAAP